MGQEAPEAQGALVRRQPGRGQELPQGGRGREPAVVHQQQQRQGSGQGFGEGSQIEDGSHGGGLGLRVPGDPAHRGLPAELATNPRQGHRGGVNASGQASFQELGQRGPAVTEVSMSVKSKNVGEREGVSRAEAPKTASIEKICRPPQTPLRGERRRGEFDGEG